MTIIGKFGADQQLYKSMTVYQIEKVPRFAFLKISAIAHTADKQNHMSYLTAQALEKSIFFPSLHHAF